MLKTNKQEYIMYIYIYECIIGINKVIMTTDYYKY